MNATWNISTLWTLSPLTSVSASSLIGLGISFHPESVFVVPFSARAPVRAAKDPAEARALWSAGKGMNAEEIQHEVEQKSRTCTYVNNHAWMPTGAKQWMEEKECEKTKKKDPKLDTEHLINHFSKWLQIHFGSVSLEEDSNRFASRIVHFIRGAQRKKKKKKKERSILSCQTKRRCGGERISSGHYYRDSF